MRNLLVYGLIIVRVVCRMECFAYVGWKLDSAKWERCIGRLMSGSRNRIKVFGMISRSLVSFRICTRKMCRVIFYIKNGNQEFISELGRRYEKHYFNDFAFVVAVADVKVVKLFKFLCIGIVIQLVSCTHVVRKDCDTNVLKCLNCSEEPLESIPLYSDLQIVKLEANSSCFISDIKQIEMTDSLIFILDLDSHLYVFSREGNFIRQISSKGEAPSEYIVLNTFFIDKERELVTLLDDCKQSLITFNFEGQYQYLKTVDNGTIRNCNQALLVDNDRLLLYNMMDNTDNMAYSLIDLGSHNLIGKYFSYAPISLNNYFYSFSSHPMTKSGEGVDFILPLCDTIFNYASSLFTPKYIVETPLKMASKSQIKSNTSSYSSDVYHLAENGYFTGFKSIHETNSKIILTYEHEGIALGYFLFDKSSHEGNYYLYTNDENVEEVPFFYTIYAYEDNFVGVEKPEALLYLKNVQNRQFQNILKELKEDDNPCLFIYKME